MALPLSLVRRRHMTGLVGTIIAALVGVAVVNLLIDPYGTFRLVDIQGLNHIKPYPEHDLVTIKAHALRHVSPDALILGNSRAEVGLDPSHRLWSDAGYQTVYNAAVPGAGPTAAVNLLERAARARPPRFIVLGIDFFDFPISPDAVPGPPVPSGDPRIEELRWSLRAILTLQALVDSVTTVSRQYKRSPSQLTAFGHNPLLDYQDLARVEGYWVLFRQRAEENARNHRRKPRNLYLKGTQSSPPFDDVRHVVRWAVQNKAELRLIVYPYHAQLMLLIDELGLWPVFEDWKRGVMRLIEEEAGEARDRVVFMDFSGFSGYTTEKIPVRKDRKASTQWYWEAGHFKKALGDVMLGRILAASPADDQADFGIPLRGADLESHLVSLRSARDHFRRSNPEMVHEVRTMIDTVR